MIDHSKIISDLNNTLIELQGIVLTRNKQINQLEKDKDFLLHTIKQKAFSERRKMALPLEISHRTGKI